MTVALRVGDFVACPGGIGDCCVAGSGPGLDANVLRSDDKIEFGEDCWEPMSGIDLKSGRCLFPLGPSGVARRYHVLAALSVGRGRA
jgi:hypothetical protein